MPVFGMKARAKSNLILLVFTMVIPGWCRNAYAEAANGAAAYRVIVNIPSMTLDLYQGNTLIKEYSVAVGKPATPTPLGEYRVFDMEKNPVWIPEGRGYIVPSGPENPLGYRWIEFLPMYGIHGTNAPWTIGTAVSGGCVRMHEEDVEDLFGRIECQTPVDITYERIVVKRENDGKVVLTIYPDIYGYKSVRLDDVDRKLADYGLRDFASEQSLLNGLKQTGTVQIPIAYTYPIILNHKCLAMNAVKVDDRIYVPVLPVAQEVKRQVVWDEQNNAVCVGGAQVPGIKKGNVVYVTADNAVLLFGGVLQLNRQECCLEYHTDTLP
jgi:hypothetical protein